MVYSLKRTFCLIVTCLALPLCVSAHDDERSEYALKAAYIYNFTKFMQWPNDSFESPSSPLNICIVGKLPEKSIVQEMASRKTQGRALQILQVDEGAKFAHCHIIYFRESDAKRISRMLTEVSGKPVLTVGEHDGFATDSGVVEFSLHKGRIRLSINHRRAKSSGIVISAQLLEIASVIEPVEQI